jgi:hypothetical protein
MLFKLGLVVATPGALKVLHENNVEIIDLLQRHVSGDWGCAPKEDQQENLYSLANGCRIMSSYEINGSGEKVWIITEADSSTTCLLLPEEY